MAKIEPDFTKQFTDKFFEFQKSGLEQYMKYLDVQLKWASKEDIRAHYKKYIEIQIKDTDKKIKEIENKLK
jgi:hypothetical protein